MANGPKGGLEDWTPKKPKPQMGAKKKYNPQEERVNRKLQGLAQRTPGSGNFCSRPGDHEFVESESFLVEDKSTEGRVLDVQSQWLAKITREARSKRRKPMVVLQWENMPPGTEKDWAAVPITVMRKLIGAAGWDWLEDE